MRPREQSSVGGHRCAQVPGGLRARAGARLGRLRTRVRGAPPDRRAALRGEAGARAERGARRGGPRAAAPRSEGHRAPRAPAHRPLLPGTNTVLFTVLRPIHTSPVPAPAYL